MGQFTRLGIEEGREIARRFSLGEVARFQPIPQGTVNSNFRIETARGPFFVRVNEGKTEEDVVYEADLLSHLSARGVPTPEPLCEAGGARFGAMPYGLVSVFPWVSGAHRDGRDARPEHVRRVGEALAAVHREGAGFPRRRASRYAFERIVERYEKLAAATRDSVLGDALAEIGAELEWLAGRAEARAALPSGVIHGDLFPDNVLFSDFPDGPRVAALLDFEQASDGAFAYDLAVCLDAWCFSDDFVPARVRALCEGYQAIRPLLPDERRLLWTEARAAAVRFTVTRITDVYLNPAATREVRAVKDFRRYLARLRRLRALGQDGFDALVGG